MFPCFQLIFYLTKLITEILKFFKLFVPSSLFIQSKLNEMFIHLTILIDLTTYDLDLTHLQVQNSRKYTKIYQSYDYPRDNNH